MREAEVYELFAVLFSRKQPLMGHMRNTLKLFDKENTSDITSETLICQFIFADTGDSDPPLAACDARTHPQLVVYSKQFKD